MLNSWQESTDATKHVFEDVAIAAWLVVYWARVYAHAGGKPPGGFVDVGCGNGLLCVACPLPSTGPVEQRQCLRVSDAHRVYILASEGYAGYGFDLRERKSWTTYTSPRPDLRVQSLNPVELISHTLAASSGQFAPPTSGAEETPWPFPRDSFLIFNHADEMTPWCPLLASMTPGDDVGFLNIPCCLHELVGRFERQTYSIPTPFLASLPEPESPWPTVSRGADSLPADLSPLLVPFYAASPLSYVSGNGKGKMNANSTAGHSAPSILGGRYHAYQLYLAHLTLRCGFIPAREALRIPSTKNFGLVGGRRSGGGDSPGPTGQNPVEIREQVAELVREVQLRGEWKARRPEGKAGDKQGH